MVDGDFTRALVTTIVAGILIVGTGTTLLFFVFRAVAEGRGGERRYLGLAVALTAFIFVCCAVFFVLSLR